jgi:uncharacterized protein YxjI
MGIFPSSQKTSSNSAALELKAPSDLTTVLTTGSQLVIKQKKELTELFLGIETRNKYMLFDETGAPCGQLLEISDGVVAFLRRIFLKSHRPLTINVIDASGKVILELTRPFFFFFSDLTVRTPHGPVLGSIQRRFALLNKIYDLKSSDGQLFARVKSPIFKIWTFSIRDNGDNEVARITKKWTGMLKEFFMDSDNFMVEFGSKSWTAAQRATILGAAISIDFDFFENNTSNS